MASKLLGFLDRDAIVTELQASTKEEAIKELLAVAVAHGLVEAKHEAELARGIMEREKKGTTGLGDGIAVPHVKESPVVKSLCGAFGRSKTGVPFDAVDGKKVHLVFLILGAKGTAADHIAILKKLAGLRQNEHFLRFLREAKDKDAIAEVIEEMAVA
ncbi:MAG TPA: PTS sugar transporter subunit IIA [Planctomycetota bacterium]|nr:PTS sugar transporter subunit IIA [Planctomycetota bacterium]